MNKFILMSFVLVISSQFVYGQEKKATREPTDVDKNQKGKDISLQAPVSSQGTGFLSGFTFAKLTASNEGTSAETNIGANYGKWTLNFKSSVPVSSKNTVARPVTISGLEDGASVSFGLQRLFFTNKEFTYDSSAYDTFASDWRTRHSGRDFNSDELTPSELRRFNRKVYIGWGVPIYLSTNFGISQQSYKYFTDSVTFKTAEEDHTNLKATGILGFVTTPGIFAFSFTYKSTYSADDAVKYYVPVGSTGVLTGLEASPGAPFHVDDFQFRVDYLTNETLSDKIFMNPNATLLITQKKLSVDLPFYFLSDKDLGFMGGIFASYITDKDYGIATDKKNFGFGLFVGGSVSNLLNR